MGHLGLLFLTVLHSVKNLQQKGKTWRCFVIKLNMPVNELQGVFKENQPTNQTPPQTKQKNPNQTTETNKRITAEGYPESILLCTVNLYINRF